MQATVRAKSSAAPRVLIADADLDARSSYGASLSNAGCDIVEAGDGRDALVKALVRHPALVVTELDLPLVDGIALCEILRRDRVTAEVPILVVTKEIDPTRHDEAKRAGADAVLLKAIDLEVFLTEARRLLVDARTPRGRAEEATSRVASELEKSAELLERSGTHHRRPMSREHRRFMTTTPPAAPPELRCPLCDRPLVYSASHIGGVSAEHAEQWDYYTCDSCGDFRYRQRTRKLRRIAVSA